MGLECIKAHVKINHWRVQMFRSYLYGYLNLFFISLSLTGSNELNYISRKYIEAADYLKLHNNKRRIFLKLCNLLGFVECYLYALIVTYDVIRIMTRKLYSPKVNAINASNDILAYGDGGWNLITLIDKSDICLDDVVFVTYPLRDNSMYRKYKHIDITLDLTYREICISYVYALRMIFFIKQKYGRRDVLFRSNSSLEYFLVSLFYIKHPEYKLCFINLLDRWAYLFGLLPNDKILIQHGMIVEGSSFIRKIGKVDMLYAFNDQQVRILKESILSNVGIIKYLRGLELTNCIQKKKNGKDDLLLICNHFFWEKEENIIKMLGKSKKVNVYIKPHPNDDVVPYSILASRYDMTLLGKTDFPKVDLAISYLSTLALEYEIAGVKVLLHSDHNFEEELKKVIQ